MINLDCVHLFVMANVSKIYYLHFFSSSLSRCSLTSYRWTAPRMMNYIYANFMFDTQQSWR
jgi:hypothetical protein